MRTLALAVLLAGAPAALTAQAFGPTAVVLPDRALDGRLKVPREFHVGTFAKVGGARFMAVGPAGVVYVSQPGSGQVTRLVDADGNGEAEAQEVLLSKLDRPHGLVVADGWLYVANTGALVRVKLDAAGKAVGAPHTVAEYSSGGGHWSRTVIVGPDGNLYVSIGSTCNICEERNDDRAAVVRFNPDGSGRVLYSSGLRNAVGMAVEPTTRQIWVTQNERDNLAPSHEDLPPEEINILQQGANFGWPWCYGDRQPNPEFRDAQRCATTVPPALKLQAHSAPLGIAFLARASRFPADLRGDALVAFHGSWNRDVPTGAKVVRVRVESGKPVGYEDFITGWQDASGRRWGRPVDVLVNADGAVLISDDQAGAIYRVWK